jgi:hypothetical protein
MIHDLPHPKLMLIHSKEKSEPNLLGITFYRIVPLFEISPQKIAKKFANFYGDKELRSIRVRKLDYVHEGGALFCLSFM